MSDDCELRLALVCYGGVSLAVYMHGITKELWHVARASRSLRDVGEAPSPTAAVYAELLAEAAERSGVRLRVMIDIVAGASAGAINGVFLAQAIATGQSLDPLTDLWLDSADVEALIDPGAAPASRFSRVWALPVAWMAAGRSGEALETVDEATRDEVRAKLAHFVRSRWFEPPFSGPGFTGVLLDAFDAMAKAPRGPRLLPPGQPLDLFVTVTDFTGHPERLELNSPPEVVETEHRLVVPFTDHGAPCDTLADPAELAFASRATSSFPGAFPPFTVAELDRVLKERKRKWPGKRAFLSRVLPRQAAVGTAERTVLIDGSVLANAPFGPAIDALGARPARRPVDRRFLYIDPSPGEKYRLAGSGGEDGVPGFFGTILGAISDLPRKQPIRDNLEAIAERSRRIERMRGIVAAIRPEVEAEVQALFGRTLFLDSPTAARLASWRRRAQVGAAASAGYSYAAYGQFKLAGVRDAVVELLCALAHGSGASRRRRMEARLADELARRGLDEAAFARGASDAAIDFLRRFDVRFRVRRLRLLLRRLGESAIDIVATEPMRDAVFESLSAYLEVEQPRHHQALREAIRSPDAALLDALSDSLDLTGLDAAADARIAAALSALPKETRRPLLLSYLGFPYFDVATLPLLGGEGLDEFDPIKVDRIAPEDARAIRGGGAEATLKGIQFGNFGAFFSRAYRENDYLWGRLHGAERAVDIVVSALPADRPLKAGRVAAIKRRAFLAILDEEEGRLTAISTLFADLRREIG